MIKNKLSILLFMTTLSAATFTSCLKDKGFENQEYGIQVQDITGVSFPEAPNSPLLGSLNSSTTAQTVTTNLSLETADVVKEDVVITLVQKPTLVATAGLTLLPSNAVTVPSTVTIKAGQKLAALLITIPNSTVLDPTQTYGIGISIASVSPSKYTIAANMKELVFGFTIKNQYDGVYQLKAQAEHPSNATLAGPVGPYEVELLTMTANSVIMGSTHPWANGSGSATPAGYEPVFTVAASNSVTVSDLSSLGFDVAPSYNSRYEATTKTFYVKWRYLGGTGYRVFTDTLKYLRAR